MLVFNGIADAAEFALYFTVTADASTQGRQHSTRVITLNSDPSWSLTLVDSPPSDPATHVTYAVEIRQM